MCTQSSLTGEASFSRTRVVQAVAPPSHTKLQHDFGLAHIRAYDECQVRSPKKIEVLSQKREVQKPLRQAQAAPVRKETPPPRPIAPNAADLQSMITNAIQAALQPLNNQFENLSMEFCALREDMDAEDGDEEDDKEMDNAEDDLPLGSFKSKGARAKPIAIGTMKKALKVR